MFNILSTAGASIQGIGYLMPVFYLTASLFFGKNAGPNPWRATGLEWQTASPPPMHNFDELPHVTCGPYEYALPSSFQLVEASHNPDHPGGDHPHLVTAGGPHGSH